MIVKLWALFLKKVFGVEPRRPYMQTASDFYAFFEKIPAEKWTKMTFKDGDKYCALGQLGIRKNIPVNNGNSVIEPSNLCFLFRAALGLDVIYVNDCGPHECAKDNILEALQAAAELGF